MPKISALTEITQPAAGDYLPILDVSDTTQGSGGSTRKISNFNILTGSEIMKPTGSNDHTQINALITLINARGGGKLFLKAGTYDASTINVCSNLTIEGEGDATIIKKKINSNVHQFQFTDVDNVLLRNLQIDGNKTNQTGLAGKIINISTTGCNNLFFDNL